jgi:hypothetical protein
MRQGNKGSTEPIKYSVTSAAMFRDGTRQVWGSHPPPWVGRAAVFPRPPCRYVGNAAIPGG